VSLAFPEIVDYWLSLIREALDPSVLTYRINCAPDLETWLRDGLADVIAPNPRVTREHVHRGKEWCGGKVSV
jgi:hypothetical protein